jgi:lactose/cellobiose-specific phosphotransferase system IIC component
MGVDYKRLTTFFYAISERWGNRPILLSIRRGLTNLIPLLVIGSLALVFLSLPVPAYQRLMAAAFGERWGLLFTYIRDGTFNILALLIAVSISYAYASEYSERYDRGLSPIIASSVSLGSFIALSGISNEGFRMANFGVTGVFIAILSSVASTLLFLKLCELKALRFKTFADGTDSTFQYAVTAMVPAALTISAFALANQLLVVALGVGDIQSWLSGLFVGLFARVGSPLARGLLFILVSQSLWFFGMHGGNILEPVAQAIFVPALARNALAVSAGGVPSEVFTKTFFDAFVLMGGCGTTLCLACALVLFGRHEGQRRLAKFTLVPMLFNINEPAIFGVPVVLNLAYLLPFLLTPLLVTQSSYAAMALGLVPYTIRQIEWTTPVLLSGYAATGSIRGSLLQLVNLALGVLCYAPFVKLAERLVDAQIEANVKKVYAVVRRNEEQGNSSALLARPDNVGSISRILAADLERIVREDRVTLFYQPQVDYEGRTLGAEALLRWKHDSYGFIYPPLVVALAEESGLIDELGLRIFDTACADLSRMNAAGFDDFVLSVNISSVQLANELFIENLARLIERHGVRPESLQIEITEQLAMASGPRSVAQIMAIKKLGVKLAMDDFGMGHSSLMYLKEYDFDTVKLDGSLVKEIMANANCRSIISSIVELGKSLNYSVLAEFVESEEQRLLLHNLGCDKYQGYLYSKALPYDELSRYLARSTDSLSA